MHCASLGEFEQGRPLAEAIRKSYPGYRLVLTFFSASGYQAMKDYEGADSRVVSSF
jgi:3-deoxy-D-manno-octulosonic-acid transferase